MVNFEWPLWVYESVIYAVAAFVFCWVVGPICYYIGLRDGKRAYYHIGVARGYQQACRLMGVKREEL